MSFRVTGQYASIRATLRSVTHYRPPRGAGYKIQRLPMLEHFTTLMQDVLKKTKALHAITQDLHPFCGIAALILGKAVIDSQRLNTRIRQVEWRKLQRMREMRKTCYVMAKKANLKNISRGISLTGLRIIIKTEFLEYKVFIFSTRTLNRPILVENQNSRCKGFIYILLDDTCNVYLLLREYVHWLRVCLFSWKFLLGSQRSFWRHVRSETILRLDDQRS